MSARKLLFAASALLCMFAACQPALAVDGHFPVVVVAADGTGDFGPQTTGTVTAGIQEAVNYCLANYRDLFIKGGGSYNISDTIYLPPRQYFKIDGGNYTINWTGPASKSMIEMDSAMDCHHRFGKLIYNGTGVAFRINPSTTSQMTDGGATINDCEVRVDSIVAGSGHLGTGVSIEPHSSWGIGQLTFSFGNIEGFTTGIWIRRTGDSPVSSGFLHAQLYCDDIHTNVNNATLFRMEWPASQNAIKLTLGIDGNATGVKGIDMYGKSNTLTVNLRSNFEPGKAVIFEMAAEANQIRLVQDPGISDVTSLVTDNSSYTTNQITWTGGPVPVKSVSVGGSPFTYTQRLYPGTAKISGGTVSNVELIRGGTTVSHGSSPGDVLLSVGDRLRITFSSAPTLQIIPRQKG